MKRDDVSMCNNLTSNEQLHTLVLYTFIINQNAHVQLLM